MAHADFHLADQSDDDNYPHGNTLKMLSSNTLDLHTYRLRGAHMTVLLLTLPCVGVDHISLGYMGSLAYTCAPC